MKAFGKLGIGGLAFVCLLPIGYGASFDCSKATTQVEKSICASERLSKMDSQLDGLYQTLLNRVPETSKDDLRSNQRTWLRSTRNACHDEACLDTVYAERVEAFKKAVGPTSEPALAPSSAAGSSSRSTNVSATSSPAPSPVADFDVAVNCAKLELAAEKAICASDRLKGFDAQLAQAFKKAKEKAGRSEELLGAMGYWVDELRNKCDSDAKCLEDAYQQGAELLRSRFDMEVQLAHSPQMATVPVPVASAAQTQKPVGIAVGNKSESPASESSAWRDTAATLLVVVALLQIPLTFWLVFKKKKESKGTVRGLVYGFATSFGILVILVVGGMIVEGEEKQAKREVARQVKERAVVDTAKPKGQDGQVPTKPQVAAQEAQPREQTRAPQGGQRQASETDPVASLSQEAATKYCTLLVVGVVGAVTDSEAGLNVAEGAKVRAEKAEQVALLDPALSQHATKLGNMIRNAPNLLQQALDMQKKYGPNYSVMLVSACMKPAGVSQVNGGDSASKYADPVKVVAQAALSIRPSDTRCGYLREELARWVPIVRDHLTHFGIERAKQTARTQVENAKRQGCLPETFP